MFDRCEVMEGAYVSGLLLLIVMRHTVDLKITTFIFFPFLVRISGHSYSVQHATDTYKSKSRALALERRGYREKNS